MSAHMHILSRAFAARIYKMPIKDNVQTNLRPKATPNTSVWAFKREFCSNAISNKMSCVDSCLSILVSQAKIYSVKPSCVWFVGI